MARRLGLPFNPELGLFRSYGDIRCQPAPDFGDYPDIRLPATWTSLTLEQMLPALRRYGALVARQIQGTGVEVRIWDLGNEVDFGTAGVAVRPVPGGCDDTEGHHGWYRAPDAIDPAIGKASVTGLLKMPEAQRIAWLRAHVWGYEARMLAAVADGIRSVDPHARFSTHVSGAMAVRPLEAVAFYESLRAGGFSPDELGVSFYPTASPDPPDRLQAFKDTALALHRALGRPVFVAEFGYPAGKMRVGFTWNEAVPGYPLTPQGQADFLRDLVSWGIEAGVLSGIRPWAPELAGTPWGPMSLFSLDGGTARARASLDAILQGVAAAHASRP